VATAAAAVPFRNPRLLSIIPTLLSAARKNKSPQAGTPSGLAGRYAPVRGYFAARVAGWVPVQEGDRPPPLSMASRGAPQTVRAIRIYGLFDRDSHGRVRFHPAASFIIA